MHSLFFFCGNVRLREAEGTAEECLRRGGCSTPTINPFHSIRPVPLKKRFHSLSIPINDTKNSRGISYIPAPSSSKTPLCTCAAPKTIHTPDPSTFKTPTDSFLLKAPKTSNSPAPSTSKTPIYICSC
ncbi:hypothetical protein NA56DRAFT_444996 [Hyaloscypha hepaticicola]|uniref:Uncharacterized protein n=1 Tax=Hyaloscypha hepaticicola TaxID=2082293 RepID=A0A2J6PGS8_9HELO|nr:hypothetical protein NA56DRAFT_444996 [Hyaloscypha hepaticicola]